MNQGEKALVPQQDQQVNILAGRDSVTNAKAIANELKEVIVSQKLYSNIAGRNYVRVEGWTTLGALMGVFPDVVDLKKQWLDDTKKKYLYSAKVQLKDLQGRVITNAYAICTSDEKNPEYAVASQAQTRATGKAYRMGFSWVIKMAGYEATPAEEMNDIELNDHQQGNNSRPAPKSPQKPLQGEISQKQMDFLHKLLDEYGMPREELKKAMKLGSMKDLSKDQASKLIDRLQKRVENGEKWAPENAGAPQQANTPPDGPEPPQGNVEVIPAKPESAGGKKMREAWEQSRNTAKTKVADQTEMMPDAEINIEDIDWEPTGEVGQEQI